jgi:chromosome partitioning protein
LGEVIGVFSAAGGVGKTTISLILGYFLRKSGRKSLLIDMDPSVCLSLYVLGEDRAIDLMERGRTISNLVKELMEGRGRYKEYIAEGRVGELNLHILPSDSRLSDVIDSLWFGPRAKRELILSTLVRDSGLADEYDFVILDTIPFYDRKYTTLTMYASDIYLVPLRPTIMDSYRTRSMLKELPKIASMEEKSIYKKTKLVFNMFKPKTRQEDTISAYKDLFLKEFPGIYVFDNYLRNLISFSRFGTEEEDKKDRKEIEQEFKPLFDEFIKICKR